MMASGQTGTYTAGHALDNREHLFRLQMLIIDGGLLVLRSFVDQKLTAATTSLSACLVNEITTIRSLKKKRTITKAQYDLLFPSNGNVSTSDLDITLLVCLLRNLKCFGLNPNYNWDTLPAQGDTSIEAAIYNLKRYRNEMSHASTTTGIQQSTFKKIWKEIREILLRINLFSANPITDLKQMIKDLKSCPIDPKSEKRIQDEIEKWRELEKAVEVDLSIVKAEVREVKGAIAKLERENKDKDNLNIAMTESHYQQQKQELKIQLIKFYKRKRSSVPLSPLIEEKDTPLAGFYVIPDIVTVEQKSPTSDQKRIRVESLRDLLNTGSDDEQEIYLSADAGFGKTAFSKYLAITWCQACCPNKNQDYFKDEELNALAEFEFLFLVLLRDTTSVCKIDEMIDQEIIKKIAPSDAKYPLQKILGSEKCLIILDGLDEWTHPDNGCPDQSEKIPHRYPRDNCVILTTTRPWKLGVSNLKTSDINKIVELDQLSQDSTRQLEKNVIRKMIEVNDDDELEEKTSAITKEIDDLGLKNMQTIPLLLMYMTCLWCNKIPIGDSKVEVFVNIIEFLLSRTTQKHPEVHSSPEPSYSVIPEYFKKHQFCQNFFSLLSALAELAYHTLFNKIEENTLVIDGSVVEKYLKADDMKLSLLSGILTESTTTTLIKRTSKVSFSHKTVQEFFVALYLSSQSDGQEKVLEKCKNIQTILDMSMIFEFLCKMNSKMMCEILTGVLPMVHEHEETHDYRTRTVIYIWNNSLNIMQKFLLSCLKEMPDSENFKFCLQDFFIYYDHIIHDKHLQRLSKLNKTNMKSLYIDIRDTISSLPDIIALFSLTDLNNLQKLFYVGNHGAADISVLLYPGLQTIDLWYALLTNYDGNCGEKLGTLKNVQDLDMLEIILSHEMLEAVFNFISVNKTLKVLSLRRLFCEEHNNCHMNFDLSKHSQLNKLVLYQLPALELNITTPSLVDVVLSGINLGKSSLLVSHDMLNVEQLVLDDIEISAASFREFIDVAKELPSSNKILIRNIKEEIEDGRVTIVFDDDFYGFQITTTSTETTGSLSSKQETTTTGSLSSNKNIKVKNRKRKCCTIS